MQNFAVFICMEETQEPRQEALRMCRLYSAQVQKYEKYISPVLSYGQIEENRREGKLSGLLAPAIDEFERQGFVSRKKQIVPGLSKELI